MQKSVFTRLLLGFFVGGLIACGTNSSSSSEMTGLYDPNIPDESGGASWTYGPKEQARGFYASGNLVNADAMPEWGEGFQKTNHGGGLNFATFDLIAVISASAAAVARRFPNTEPLRVGPLSGARGGVLAGHESHQNGLDADLGYFRKSGRLDPYREVQGFGPSLVRRRHVIDDFDYERNYLFLRYLVNTGRVSRVFTHSAIKAGLCRHARQIGVDVQRDNTLRLLRPYPGHGDHMHVRMTCPRNSSRCRGQAPVGPETGC